MTGRRERTLEAANVLAYSDGSNSFGSVYIRLNADTWLCKVVQQTSLALPLGGFDTVL